MKQSFRSRWFRWLPIGLLALLSLGLYGDLRRRQHALETWRRGATGAGWMVDSSPPEPGLLSTRIRELRLRRAGIDAMQGVATDLVVQGLLVARPRLSVASLRLVFTGEPDAVFDAWQSTPQWDWFKPKVVTFEYAHKLLGKLVLEGVTFKAEGPRHDLHAEVVRLRGATWRDVQLSVQRRNRLIEVGIGTGPISAAPITIGYFPSSRGASQWTLSVSHQSARAFAQRLGWDVGMAFAESFIGGSVTLVIPDNTRLNPRGSVQLVIDNWPKPAWPDRDALLGSTASFFARVEPSIDMQSWALPEVDLSQALFSLRGTGRLSLGNHPSLSFDTRGTRTCAQLEANLPASSYADQAKRYLADCPPAVPSTNCAERRRQSVSMRLQVAATDLLQSNHHVAWHLDAGCGLAEQNSGSFRELDLPAATSTDVHATPR